MAKQLNVALNISANTTQAQNEIKKLQQALDNAISTTTKSSGETKITKEITEATNAASKLKVMLDSALNPNTGNLDLSKFSQELTKNKTSLQQYANQLTNLGPAGEKAFLQMANAIVTAEVPMRRSSALLNNMWTTLRNTARWQISSTALHTFMGAIQGAYGYAKDLNESLNNIRIVTGASVEEMSKFAEQANKAAQSLSSTTVAYTDAALIYYQQGIRDENEIAERVATTLKLSNVTHQNAEDVSDQMTAIWNNFYDGSHSLEYYADVITALGAATASSSEEISTGLEKFAAVAETVGLSYEYATSALATITATTRQSADVVGTALKTLFARIQDLEVGKTLEDGTSLGKYSQALQTIGVNIKDTNGEVKDMNAILDEMGEKWNTISKDTQIAVAQTVAGTRQYTQLLALMDNWDFMKENLEIVKESEGTLQEQADTYAESWQAASRRVRSAWEDILSDLIDDKFFITLLNGIVEITKGFDGLIQSIGGLPGVLSALGAIVTNAFGTQLAAGLSNAIQNLRVFSGIAEQEANELRSQASSAVKNFSNPDSSLSAQMETTVMKDAIDLASKLQQKTNELNAEDLAHLRTLSSITQEYGNIAIEAQKAAEEAELNQGKMSQQMRNTATQHIIDNARKENPNITSDELQSTVTQQLQEYSNIKDAFDMAIESGLRFNQTIKELANSEKELNSENIKEIKAALDNLGNNAPNQVQKVKVAIEKYEGAVKGAKKAQEDLNKASSKTERTKSQDNLNRNLGDIKINSQAVKTAIGELSTSLESNENIITRASVEFATLGADMGVTVQSATKMGEAILNTVNSTSIATTAQENYQRSLKATREELEKVSVAGSLKSFSDNIIMASQGLSQLSMGISSLAGMFQTLNNTDLSFGQKLLSVMTSLSMTIPMLITGFSKLHEVTLKFNTETEKTVMLTYAKIAGIKIEEGQTAALTAEKIRATIAEKLKNAETSKGIGLHYAYAASAIAAKTGVSMLTASLITLGATIAAITIVAAGLVIAFNYIKNASPEGALENAKNAAKEAGEAANEANKAYKDLKNTIEGYQTVRDKIDNLTSGTKEFKDAVEEANDAARKLMKLYGVTNFTVDKNGVIQLKDSDLENKENEYFNKAKNADNLSTGADNYQREKENIIAQDNIVEAVSNRSNLSERGESRINRYINSSNISKIIEDASSTEGGSKVYFAGDQARENIAKTMGWDLENLTSVQEDFVNAIIASEESLIDFKNSLNSNTAANEAATKAQLASNLAKHEEFLNNDIDKNTVLSAQINRSRILENETDFSSRSDKDILDEYKNKQGYDSYDRKFWTGKVSFKDEEGKEVASDLTIEDIKAQLREMYLQDQMEEDALNNTIQAVTEVLNNAGDNKNIISSTIQGIGPDNLTLSQLENEDTILKSLKLTSDEEAEQIGFQTAEAFNEALKGTISKGNDIVEDLGLKDLNLDEEIKDALTVGAGKGLSETMSILGDNPSIKDNFISSLNKMISTVDEDKRSEALDQLMSIKWSDWDSIAQADKALQQFNGDIDRSADEWIKFQNTLREVTKSVPNFGKLKDDISEVTKVISGLDFGKTIKPEDYQKITNYNDAWKDLFILQSDGNQQFIGTAEQKKDILLALLNEEKEALEGLKETDSETYEKEYKILSEQFAASASTFSELEAFKGQISEDAYSKQLDFLASSAIKTATSLDELNEALREVQGTDAKVEYELISESLINFGSQYENCSKELSDYKKALVSGSSELIENAESALKSAISIGEMAKSLGLSGDSIEEQTRALRENNSALKDDSKTATRAAIINQSMNKGIQSLVDNWKDWKKALTTTSKTSQDYIDATLSVKDALASLLGVSNSDFIPDGFLDLPEVMDNIEKASKGNVQAINELGITFAKATIESFNFSEGMKGLDIATETSFSMAESAFNLYKNNILEGITNLTQQIQAGTLQAGDSITELMNGTGLSWAQALNEMAYATGMTVEEMNSLLNELGVQADVTTATKTLKTKVPVYETREEIINNGSNGEPKITRTASHIIDYEEMDSAIEVAQINMGEDKGTPPSITYAGRAPAAPSALKPSKGGSGGSTPKKTTKATNPEEHRYAKVENEIENLSSQYDRLSDIEDRLWGAKKLDAMDAEIDKLHELGDAYKEYLKEIAGDDWEKLHNKIQSGAGVTLDDILTSGGNLAKDFKNLINGTTIKYVASVDKEGNEEVKTFNTGTLEDVLGLSLEIAENGQIANIDAIRTALDNYFTTQEGWWNSLSATQQEQARNQNRWKQVELTKEAIEKALEQADETAKKLEENSDELQQNTYAIQDLNFKRLNEKLNIKVELSDKTIKRLETAIKVLGDDVYKAVEVMNKYFSVTNTDNLYNTARNRGSNYEDFWNELQDKYNANEISQADFIEGINTAQEGLYGVIDQILDINDTMRGYYKNTLDSAVEELTKLTDQMEHQVSVMDHLKNILSLLGRQQDYRALDTLIQGQVKMRRNALDESTAELRMFQDQVAQAEATYRTLTGDAARQFKLAVLDPAIEQAREAEEKMYADAEALAESVNELFTNTLDSIMSKYEDALSNGLGWDFLADSMDRAQSIQDEYLTKTNQIYETNSLMRKLSQDIDKTDNIASKNKLKNFSNEIKAMQDQEKLSKTDLEIAKARYEVLLAQIQLEEAKNAKTTVRLQRDNEGNFGYVYTANQDQIDDAEQNLADKQNDLYNLVLEQTNEYGEKIVQLQQERDAKLRELAEQYQNGEITSYEEYQRKVLEVTGQYNDLLTAAYDSYYTGVKWLNETATTDYTEAWVTNYENVIEAGANYENTTLDMLDEIGRAIRELDSERTEITNRTALGLDNISAKTNELVSANDDLKNELIGQVIPAMDKTLSEVQDLTAAWARQYDQIMDLIKEYQDLIAIMQKAQNSQTYDKNRDYSSDMIAHLRNGGSVNDATIAELNDTREAKIEGENLTADQYIDRGQDTINRAAAKAYSNVDLSSQIVIAVRDEHKSMDSKEVQDLWANRQAKIRGTSGLEAYANETLEEMLNRFGVVGAATGGYTGEWGSSGKLAFLHEKEIILNKEDTQNFLDALTLTRKIISAIDLKAASQALGAGLTPPTYYGEDQILEQEVTIHAEFPNATDHNEIEEAFDNLINRATQYASRARVNNYEP